MADGVKSFIKWYGKKNDLNAKEVRELDTFEGALINFLKEWKIYNDSK